MAAVRIGAIAAGSALMGVAGAFLTLAAFNAFYFNMVNGRGWICVALVVFASWRPGKALLGALLFALFDALQLRLQQSGSGLFGVAVPYQIYLMLPYLLSIVALVLVARRASLSAGADEAVPQGRTLESRRTAMLLITQRHPARRPQRHRPAGRRTAASWRSARALPDAPGAEVLDAAGLAAQPALRRRALPHGRDAQPTACRASTRAARCSKASRCGAS